MSGAGCPWADISTTIARRSFTGSFAVRVIRCNRWPQPSTPAGRTPAAVYPPATTSHPECWETSCPIHPQNQRITRSMFKDEALGKITCARMHEDMCGCSGSGTRR